MLSIRQSIKLMSKKLLAVIASLAFFVCPSGCNRSGTTDGVQAMPERPLRKMQSLVRRGLWEDAAELIDAVAATHPDDAEALELVARVADANQQKIPTMQYLIRACEADSYASEQRINQAFVAAIAAGHLHDGTNLLEAAIKANPERFQIRRLLYDFQMGLEDRVSGVKNGRVLIRQRRFDLELLMSLSNTGRRTMDAKPLEQMLERNPDDKRPLIGLAKTKLDQGELEDSIDLLRSIVVSHPDSFPAQALLCFVYAQDGQFETLETHLDDIPPGVADYPKFWLAMGQWLEQKRDFENAVRAYWEACLCDQDATTSWLRLAGALRSYSSASGHAVDDQLNAVQRKAGLLSELDQQRNRFERSGKVSREIASEIVLDLEANGRLWEAEAWASVALTLPPDDSVDLESIRQSIVLKLTADTAWQSESKDTQVLSGLSEFPLPKLDAIDFGAIAAQRSREQSVPLMSRYKLVNEAQQRGLDFFGRTSDQLDQPGISLHQTLGCGGGTIDFDLDGWSDLYLMAAGGAPGKLDSESNGLFQNVEGSFVRVDGPAGAGDVGFGQGLAVGDINEDGFPDLLLLNYGPNRLLLNQGDGTFSDQTQRWLPNNEESGWSTSGAIADIDQDGIADAVILNYCVGFDPVTKPCATDDRQIARSCSPLVFDAQPDIFLQGLPDGRLLDRTELWNARPAIPGRGLGLEVGSFDNEQGLDVFVANDITNNHYWSGDSSGDEFQLRESGLLRGLAVDDQSLAQGSMGIATADWDYDGDADFYVTNFDGEYNTLCQQTLPGLWRDTTKQLGDAKATLPLVGFGAESIDLNNDGQLELVVTNGHVDIFTRDDKTSVYRQPLQLFEAQRGQGLRLVEFELPDGDRDSLSDDSTGSPNARGTYLSDAHVGRALWKTDVDRDSREDLIVTHQTEPVALLMNQSVLDRGTRAVTLRLIGTSCSRDAVGTSVLVEQDGDQAVYFTTAGDGYLCSAEASVRFPLNVSVSAVSMTINWPDGSTGHADLMNEASEMVFVQGIGLLE